MLRCWFVFHILFFHISAISIHNVTLYRTWPYLAYYSITRQNITTNHNNYLLILVRNRPSVVRSFTYQKVYFTPSMAEVSLYPLSPAVLPHYPRDSDGHLSVLQHRFHFPDIAGTVLMYRHAVHAGPKSRVLCSQFTSTNGRNSRVYRRPFCCVP